MPHRPIEGTPRILVVDDDRMMRELARAAIESEGFAVDEAEDGEAALAAFDRRPPDLVLLDVVMPGIDGFQACERLRARPAGRHVPILVMTGLEDDDSIRRAYGAGATDFVTKPIPWQVLGQRMRYMLRAGRAFAEVEASRATLEAKVAERTAELRASNEELEAFCAAASHDLRAPLRWIGGYADMLAEDNPGLPAESLGHLERIRASSTTLTAMLEALLAMSRITLREARWESFDFTALVMEVLNAQRAAHPHRCVELAIQPDMRARGDRELVRVVLANLVSNACKYTVTTADARLEIGCAGATEPVYFVKDNGVGFDMAHARKLFLPFRRLHAPEEFEGIGIGLSTVRRIVARHGGRIWAESQPGRGATFRFTLAPAPAA